MDSDQLAPNQIEIIAFLKSQNVHMVKINERQWGSYEPGVSHDGHGWLSLRHTYGWGYSLEYAVADAITKLIDHPDLLNWLRMRDIATADARFTQLREIVHGRNHDVQTNLDPDRAGLHVLSEQPGDTSTPSGDA